MKKIINAFCLLGMITGIYGCATIGNNFPHDFASGIEIDKTTRMEIEKTLGPPFRTGLDSGDSTATYLYYRLGLFINPTTKDLTITYSPKGLVKKYIFNSNVGPE